MKNNVSARFVGIILCLVMLVGILPMSVLAGEEGCPHTNLTYIENELIDPSCFEPGLGGYWVCEECGQYLDKNKEHGYWEEALASKIPALGHSFNADTGKCDNCDLENPVYSKVTSLADINEEDMYIFVAEVDGRYFVLGGLDESTATSNEQGIVDCGEGGNAIPVVPYDDGSISLLNQNYVGNARPSEFMFDIDPEWFNSDLDDNFGLTPVMLKLPNYCVYPFQSYSLDNTGYIGVPRYANGVYGMWDATEWILDFYTTEVNEDTYRDDMDGLTHAEQVARGNIGDNISEGDLLMYRGSYYAVGGAMFTLRFREYVNGEGVTEYYFICGEDWALVGSSGWDYVTDTTPTNDTQYAVSLYRYDVPEAPEHTHNFVDGRCECGESDPNYVPPHNHVFVDGRCECGETDPNYVPPHNHVFVDGRCECGEEDPNYVQHDHSFGDWICEATVVGKHYRACECGEREYGDCQWDGGEITLKPDYDAYGEMTYTCDLCEGTKKERVDMLVKVDEILSSGEEIKVSVPEGSDAALDENTILEVDRVEEELSSDTHDSISASVGEDKQTDILATYDIELLLDGANVQPGGEIEVTLPIPENSSAYDSLQVVYIDANGDAFPCETTVNGDGTLTFLTNHFSRYAVIGVKAEETEAPPLYVWIIALVVGILIILACLFGPLFSKKKAESSPETEPETPEKPEAPEAPETPEKPEENPDNSSEEE